MICINVQNYRNRAQNARGVETNYCRLVDISISTKKETSNEITYLFYIS